MSGATSASELGRSGHCSALGTQGISRALPTPTPTRAQLLSPVAELISRLSQTLELLPGDLIFTGTAPGVGAGMKPKRFLVAGEIVVTEIEGIGRITQRFHG